MATVGEAIAATLIAQWTAAGGTQPDPIQYLVERPERDPNPTVADAVYVWLPLRRKFDPVDVAGTYRNVTYTIRIVCHTKTSSARQKEIENEVDRILNTGTVITGATKQTVKEINDISNRTYSVLPKYISEVIVEVFTAMEVSATAYGTGTTSTFETDELTVNTHITGLGLTITDFLDEDNMVSDSAAAFASQQSVKAYADALSYAHADLTDTTLTGAYLEDLLMFGSANKRYINCIYWGTSQPGKMKTGYHCLTNVDGQDQILTFQLSIAHALGSLGLHIDELKVGLKDADAGDYLDAVYVYGYSDASSSTSIPVTDGGTNQTAAGTKTYTIGDTDMSGYVDTKVALVLVCTDAEDIDISWVRLQCWYE